MAGHAKKKKKKKRTFGGFSRAKGCIFVSSDDIIGALAEIANPNPLQL